METNTLLNSLRAAGEPTRLRLLALCSFGELTVSELVQILGQSQPRVSRHLKLLVDAGLLDRFREGTWAFYRPAGHGEGAEMTKILSTLVSQNDPMIASDLARLGEIKKARQERSNAYFNKNAPIWNELRSLYVAEENVEAALNNLLSEKKIQNLLDIGTGTGRMLELFSGQIDDGVGVDLSHEMLEIARSKLEISALSHCQVRHADMYRLPFPPNSFDAITIHQVLHFSDDPGAVIREASHVLRPEGKIAIVDFAPHELELLRDTHAHRRLGFGDSEVSGWFTDVGLTVGPSIKLSGSPLTVCIWTGDSPAKGGE